MKRFLLSLIALAFLAIVPTSAEAAARFAICATTCTWDNSSTAMWSTTSGGGTGASAPGTSDDVTLDANTCTGGTTCTITVNANLTIRTLSMGACTASTAGCILDFSANNNTVTISNSGGAVGVSISGTGTRTLKMGTGAWTLSGSGNMWDATTTTNLTFTGNTTSTIALTNNANAAVNFKGGGLTGYGTLALGPNSNGGVYVITGNNTFSNLTGTAPFIITGTSGGATTQTITNAFTIAGSSSNKVSFLAAAANIGVTYSVASGTPSLDWAVLWGATFSGGATFSATNSISLGAVSGITVTAPSSGGGGGIIGG